MADIGIIKFQLGGIDFGVYADKILEIVQFTGARPIPRPLPYVVGITELRHYIVIVVDLRKRLGLSPFPLEKGTTMIVTKISLGMIGVLVESISHFKRIPEDHILPPIPIAGFSEQLLHGVLTEKDDIMLLPDIDKIFSSYLHVQLLPITPAEKIAFQYRFTPGSLTRTLENTLISQGYLDQRIVNKLSRSMCVPSVFVHKITSFYHDYSPRGQIEKNVPPVPGTTQEVKAGDETYLSLSQQLLRQQEQREQQTRAAGLKQSSDIEELLTREPTLPLTTRLGKLLHCGKEGTRTICGISAKLSTLILTQPPIGRCVAKTLRMPSTRLTKYMSYHAYPGQKEALYKPPSAPAPAMTATYQSVEERLQHVLNSSAKMNEALYTLNAEHAVLRRSDARKIAAYYQTSTVTLVRLCGMFPDITFLPDPEPEVEGSDVDEEHPKTTRRRSKTGGVKSQKHGVEPMNAQKSGKIYSKEHMSERLQSLADENMLHEDQAVRSVAAQLRLPACRLSKFRSYYHI